MELGSTAADAESKGSSPGAHRRSPWWAAFAVAVTVALVVQAGVDGTAAATRAVMYGGVLAAAGVTLFQVLAHDGAGPSTERRQLRAVVLVGAGGAALATNLGVVLQLASASGRGWAGLFDARAADVVFGSSSHLGAGQRVLGLVLLAYAAHRRSEGAATGGLLGVSGVLITLSSLLVAGHAATREPRNVGFAIDLVHTTTAAIWAGGIIGLAIVLRARRPAAEAAAVFRRFSLAAAGSVTLLLATGIGLSWAELGPSDGVPFNGYGLVLLSKAAVAMAVIAVGAVNHFVVVPAVEAGEETSWATLTKTLHIELALLVALVALTGTLTGLEP